MRFLASSPFIDSLQHITGFLVVVIALALLWMVTAGVGKLVQHFEVAAAPAKVPPSTTRDEDELEEEEVAAIAACVVAILGRRSRIVSIRRGRSTDWNREGRREHFSSRRIR